MSLARLLHTPEYVRGMDYLRDAGFPGAPPYTRGIAEVFGPDTPVREIVAFIRGRVQGRGGSEED